MALNGSVSLTINASQSVTAGLGQASNTLAKTVAKTIANGSGANQANVLWSSSRSLTGTAEDLDLNGVLTDAYGASVNLLRVKGIYIGNLSSTDGQDILVGGAGSNAWVGMVGGTSHKIKVGPSGFFFNYSPLATGFPVVSGTGDQLHIDPQGATLTYEIAILGSSS
jgi:hypothetical protein